MQDMGIAMEIAGPIGYRSKLVMKAVDGMANALLQGYFSENMKTFARAFRESLME